MPDPSTSGPSHAGESWLVIEAGHVPLLWSTGDDHQWEGKLFLYLTGAVQFTAPFVQAVHFGFTPKKKPGAWVDRQDPKLPFEGLPVMLAISGTHTGDDSQSTYGVSGTAKIEPDNPPSPAPPKAGLRPSIEAKVGVWGEDATLSSVAFYLSVNAEYSFS